MNGVSTIIQVDLLIYSIVLNIIMYYYVNQANKLSNHSIVFFKRILHSTMFMTTIEAIFWLIDPLISPFRMVASYLLKAILHMGSGLIAAFGLSYLDYKIFRDNCGANKRLAIYFIPTYINIILVIYNHFSKEFIVIMEHYNRYVSDIGYNISNIILYAFTGIVLMCFYRYKNLVIGRVAGVISKVILVPIIGSVVQMTAYGTTFGITACTLASFTTLLLVEKNEMTRDSLTNLYTRTNLEERLAFKLKTSEAFSVVLIDLNNFKKVNDTYGHLEGDKVLQKVAEILKYNIRSEDMVCRYGGDEFCLIIENQNTQIDEFVKGLDLEIEEYNAQASCNYQIEFSYGYEYINQKEQITVQELIHRIDQKMYIDKKARKIRSLE